MKITEVRIDGFGIWSGMRWIGWRTRSMCSTVRTKRARRR